MTTPDSDRDEAGERRRVNPEPKLLGAALVVLLGGWGFSELADAVDAGATRTFDQWILEQVRTEWAITEQSQLAEVAENFTALGGTSVLAFVTLAVVGYLLLRRAYGLAVYMTAVVAGGSLISYGLKFLFDRPRPTVVEPLDIVHTASFPSGHAMSSAFVYLTLAVLIAADEPRRSVKIYVLAVALLLTLLIGLTRVLLAVHYPTDVLAGWVAGLAWALLGWIGYNLLGRP